MHHTTQVSEWGCLGLERGGLDCTKGKARGSCYSVAGWWGDRRLLCLGSPFSFGAPKTLGGI